MKNKRLSEFIKEEVSKRMKKLPDLAKAADIGKVQKLTEQHFVQEIVRRMKTVLVEPDQIIIHNLAKVTKDDSMYLIAKGECKASIVDKQEEDSESEGSEGHDFNPNVKLLRPGSYFGEISIIFGCERTA